jgi:hypothetical protein
MRHVLLGLFGLMSASALTGCRNRAYNDLYVENMASEIRDLENQLYEYDHEYRLLEQELESLRHQNAALRAVPSPSTTKRSLLSPSPTPDYYNQPESTPAPLEFQPRKQSLPLAPAPQAGAKGQPQEPGSILEEGRSSRQQSPQFEEIPAPRAGERAPSGPAVIPERLPNLPPPITPPAANQPGGDPRPALPESNLPGLRDSNPIDPTLPDLSPSLKDDEIKPDELMPPTIEPGVPVPPELPSVTQRTDGTPVAPEDHLEMNLSRIDIPNLNSSTQLASNSQIKQATIQVATEKVTDTRVVELAFHPTLSRAIDMDDRPDDDGLYLVLQPKNERGQMVPIVASLIIFALDPAREGDAAKIGRWEYSAADIEAKLQPIGSEQGIHLRLPWNGPDPSADRVIVFALFKFDNGRQVMGEKEIFISSDGSHKTVWTPRGGRSGSSPAVAQAGYSASPLAPSSGNTVVRPASGTSTLEPAPEPNSFGPN